MSIFTDASSLVFFKAEEYVYNKSNVFDASALPRPHYCIGLILSGEAVFKDSMSGENVQVRRGDLIFVPMGSTYLSTWVGSSEIRYISMHFVFDRSDIFPQKNLYKFASITVEDLERYEKMFRKALSFSSTDAFGRLTILSFFYELLSFVSPRLEKKIPLPTDERLENAIGYIEKNYAAKISVEDLAAVSRMSVSRFFPLFKSSTGMTPIDFLNNYRIGRAIILLMNDDELSIEEISEKCGFESSAYFRRVFKKTTGRSPRAYRSIAAEL